MIISHKYKFIFIKSTKTAGTSVELALSRFCGENDIITPVGAKDEVHRPADGMKPQFYKKRFPWQYSLGNLYDWLNNPEIRKNGIALYGQHSYAIDVKKNIGDAIWDSYFKFTIERNPWDKVVSAFFYHRYLKDPDISFEQFVREKSFYNSSPIYCDAAGKPMVDFFMRYEHLNEDFEMVCKKLSIPYDGKMPMANTETRKEKKHYSEYYTDELKNIVADKCKNVIDLMGYTF